MNLGRFAALAIAPVAIAFAAPGALAQSETNDPRLVTHEYDATEVVKINGRVGVQATISFEENEQIENVAVGDSQQWQITPNKRANLLFVKPLEAAAVTNMTVVTNKRTYLFDLVASSKQRPVYMFQFTYKDATPAPEAVPAPFVAGAQALASRAPVNPAASESPALAQDQPVEAPAKKKSSKKSARVETGATPAAEPAALNQAEMAILSGNPNAAPYDPGALNFAWGRKGDAALLPSRVFDDGQATYLTWTSAQTIPAILTTNGKGEEGPVNYSVRGETIVIDTVPSRILLRSGSASATLDNLRDKRSSASLYVPVPEPIHPFVVEQRARLALNDLPATVRN